MSSPEDTAQRIRSALEPFVRPREEAAAIRRVLKAHLATSLKSDDDVLDGSSLGLVNLGCDAAVLPEARGLHKNYLRALQANLEARRAFDQRATEAASTAALASSSSAAAAAVPSHDTPGSPFGARPGSHDPSILQDHLVTVKLRRKQHRLQTVNRYLDALAERPVAVAAGEDYLQPEFIYGDAETVLPSVPKAVVDGLAEDEAERAAAGAATGDADSTEKAAKTTADLEKLVAQLEKSVLRSQLGLKEEEQRLAAARATSARREAITRTSRAAKLQALGTARDELIGWIETELGNAANGGDAGGDNDPDESAVESSRMLRQSLLNGKGSVDASGLHDSQKKAELGERLAEIQAKYAHYVSARKQLVDTVGSMSSDGSTTRNALFANIPQLGPPQMEKKDAGAGTVAGTRASDKDTNSNTAAAAETSAALGQLLLVPYLERLLAVAHDQKADISHKAHHNALLSKRLRDTLQLLDHLADESQLLPRYGPQSSRGAGGGAASGAGGGGGAALLLRKKGVLAPAGKDDNGPDGICQRVSAWTFAADSAKIATFESVFEQVEEGQVALEQAAEALAEADMLLGREPEEDAEQKRVPRSETSDIWAGLDGEVGLLRSGSR